MTNKRTYTLALNALLLAELLLDEELLVRNGVRRP